MDVSMLIDRLRKFPQDAQVMILDGSNGAGCPRDLNYGPHSAKITADDAEECGDCEGREGEAVVIIGFGCY